MISKRVKMPTCNDVVMKRYRRIIYQAEERGIISF